MLPLIFKMLLGVALGAGVGASVSLEITTTFGLWELMWIPGAFVGAMVGWVAFAPIVFWRSFRRAITEEALDTLIVWLLRGVQGLFLGAAVLFFLILGSVLPAVLAAGPPFVAGLLWKHYVLHDSILVMAAWWGVGATIWCVHVAEEQGKNAGTTTNFVLAVNMHGNAFVALWQAVRGLWWLAVHIPNGLRVAGRVALTTLRYSRSHEREYVATFAGAGAIIGHLAWSVLSGVLAGVVLAGVIFVLLRLFERLYLEPVK